VLYLFKPCGGKREAAFNQSEPNLTI